MRMVKMFSKIVWNVLKLGRNIIKVVERSIICSKYPENCTKHRKKLWKYFEICLKCCKNVSKDRIKWWNCIKVVEKSFNFFKMN